MKEKTGTNALADKKNRKLVLEIYRTTSVIERPFLFLHHYRESNRK